MKANELRVRDWFISVKFGVPVQCDLSDLHELCVRSDGAYNDPPIDEIFEPIPLTEEWLLKFRFHESPMDEIMTFRKDGFCLNITGGKGFYTCTYKGSFTRFITHVHQLQNLYFALTGNELEIK